jgi:hypothetical protein
MYMYDEIEDKPVIKHFNELNELTIIPELEISVCYVDHVRVRICLTFLHSHLSSTRNMHRERCNIDYLL